MRKTPALLLSPALGHADGQGAPAIGGAGVRISEERGRGLESDKEDEGILERRSPAADAKENYRIRRVNAAAIRFRAALRLDGSGFSRVAAQLAGQGVLGHHTRRGSRPLYRREAPRVRGAHAEPPLRRRPCPAGRWAWRAWPAGPARAGWVGPQARPNLIDRFFFFFSNLFLMRKQIEKSLEVA
jgi:hypothetical protein